MRRELGPYRGITSTAPSTDNLVNYEHSYDSASGSQSTSKGPLDGLPLGVATSLPSGHLTSEELLVADSAVQALTPECGDLDFGDVQPACMFGCVVEDHPAKKLGRGAGAKGLLKAGAERGTQVVENQMDACGRTIHGADQMLYEGDELRRATMFSHLRHPSTPERFYCDKHVACPGSNILIVPTQRRSRHHRQARRTVVQQLFALLVDANYRFARAPRLGVSGRRQLS